ncbi:DcaP family trimeric outer membrane transporter [Saccharicrinis sp. GN24d3]|uniref:DcaP family trimeric outer membrane transporter n=1 Tax=Saccharicrinis sp. GN24d3 TaxID=3458416 RepID=UPI0040368D9F
MKKLILSLLAFGSLLTNAQETEKKITVKTYGFIGFDAFVDSRASLNVRGSGLIYPLGPEMDDNGNDINNRSKFDFTASITRIGFAIKGPDAFGAATSAKIEADFAGTSGNNRDFAVRLRQAFFNLDWGKSSLLAGQTWHPMFIPENFPATVNFVVGVPFHPLSRAPQLRYTVKPADNFSIALFALSQGDFINKGIIEQVEMSDFPELTAQLKYGSTKDFWIGATLGIKQVQPTPLNDNMVVTKNKLTSMHGNLSLRYTTSAVTFKAEGVYGGNMTNMVMIGGLARKTRNGNPVNAEYEAIRTSSIWTDIHTNGKNVQFGVFAAISNNHGTEGESVIYKADTDPSTPGYEIDESIYTLGGNIEKLYIISPRITFTSGPLKLGLEINRTVASYGSGYNEKSKPINTKDYGNTRLVLGFRYYF